MELKIVLSLVLIGIIAFFVYLYMSYDRIKKAKVELQAINRFRTRLFAKAKSRPELMDCKFDIFMSCLVDEYYNLVIMKDFRLSFVPKEFVKDAKLIPAHNFDIYQRRVNSHYTPIFSAMSRLNISRSLINEFITLNATDLYNFKAIDDWEYFHEFKEAYKEALREKFFIMGVIPKKKVGHISLYKSSICLGPLHKAASELDLVLLDLGDQVNIINHWKF